MKQIANTKQMKMIDTLKRTKQFSEEDITKFVEKVTDSTNVAENISAPRIEIAWTLEDMVSATVERVEFCKNEILSLARSFNEIIINNILRKTSSGIIKVKVIADVSLIGEYIKMNENKDLDLNDKNAIERNNVLTNPWYPNNGNIDRRISSVPYNMFISDSMDVGLELIDWNEPRKFHGVVFIKDEYVAKIMRDFYYKIWDIAASFPPSFKQQQQQRQQESGLQ